MLRKKFISSIMGTALIITSMSIPTLATSLTEEVDKKIDYNEISYNTAQLEPGSISARASYHVASAKWFILDSRNIGVGGAGWTNLTSKATGKPIRHYANVRAYHAGGFGESGREWDTGRNDVTTGNLGVGAVSSVAIYYGT